MANNKELERIANHLEILNDEVGNIKVSIAGIQVDVKWLKAGLRWLMGLIATLVISGVVYAIFS